MFGISLQIPTEVTSPNIADTTSNTHQCPPTSWSNGGPLKPSLVVALQRSSRMKPPCTSCRRSIRSCRRQPKSKSPSRLTTTRWCAVACTSTTPARDRWPCVSDHGDQDLKQTFNNVYLNLMDTSYSTISAYAISMGGPSGNLTPNPGRVTTRVRIRWEPVGAELP